MAKLNFQQPLLKSSMSQDHSEIIMKLLWLLQSFPAKYFYYIYVWYIYILIDFLQIL